MSILPLPEHFGSREWFIIVTLICSNALIIPLRRKFPPTIIILILVFGLTSAKIMDVLVGEAPFDYYDINDTPKVELMDVVLQFIYPPFAYLYIYLYERLHIRGISTALYVLISSFFGICFEWIFVCFGVFMYKGWNLFYSFTVYLYVQSACLLFFKWIQSNHHRKR